MPLRTRLGALVLAAASLLSLMSCSRAVSSSTVATSSAPEHLITDTPKKTVGGATFVAPAEWIFSVRGPATILAAPEGDSHIALVDVRAPSADSAVALAWASYKPDHKWPLKVVTPAPDKDGWAERYSYTYQTSPNEKRSVGVYPQRAPGRLDGRRL